MKNQYTNSNQLQKLLEMIIEQKTGTAIDRTMSQAAITQVVDDIKELIDKLIQGAFYNDPKIQLLLNEAAASKKLIINALGESDLDVETPYSEIADYISEHFQELVGVYAEVESLQQQLQEANPFAEIGYKTIYDVFQTAAEDIEYSKSFIPSPDATKVSFYNNQKLKYAPYFELDTPLTSCYMMFQSCSSLLSIPLFDTSNVTNTQSMFAFCQKLITIPALDTSNVTKMDNMFSGCTSLLSIPLLDTSNVTKMDNMFGGCTSLLSIPLLDTSKVTNMSYMFSDCNKLTTIPALDTSKVTNMQLMFSGCASLLSIPLLDTSKVTSMSYMFSGCTSLLSIPLLDTSNVISTSDMFYGCSKLSEINIVNLGTQSSITTIDFHYSPWVTGLYDSLYTNSFDRATAGYSTRTLKLSTTSKDTLTDEQIAAITAKGYTIS